MVTTGVALLIGSLTMGLRPTTRHLDAVRVTPGQYQPQVIDCGNPLFKRTDISVATATGTLNPCMAVGKSRAGLAKLGLFLGLVLLAAPFTVLRRSRRPAPVVSVSRIRRVDQFIAALILWTVTGSALLLLFRFNWGIKTYYGNSLPAEGVARLALGATIVIVAGCIAALSAGMVRRRWPGIDEQARRLLVLGIVTASLVAATGVTAVTLAQDANCWSGCTRLDLK